MTERKTTETEVVRKTSGSELERDVDPNSPEHKDAGQEYVDRDDVQTARETLDESERTRAH